MAGAVCNCSEDANLVCDCTNCLAGVSDRAPALEAFIILDEENMSGQARCCKGKEPKLRIVKVPRHEAH